MNLLGKNATFLGVAFVLIAIQARCESARASVDSNDEMGSPIVSPNDLAENEIRLIYRARTINDIDSSVLFVRERGQELRRSRQACQAQLKNRLPPTICFQVVSAERALGLLSSQTRIREMSWLSRLCRESASLIGDEKVLMAGLKERGVPKNCREVIEERLADLRYGSHSNAELAFKRRFERIN